MYQKISITNGKSTVASTSSSSTISSSTILGKDFATKANKRKRILPVFLVALLSLSVFTFTINFTATPSQAATATAFGVTIGGETLDVEVENNEAFTLQVEALDESLQTMDDYDGTISITSSDNNAVLPAEYTFKLADSGIKSFDLGLKLTSPGEQTITIQDVGSSEIMGVISVTVSGSGGGSVDPDSPIIYIPSDGTTINENTIEIVGTAIPNAEVTVYDGTEKLGTTETDSDGEFTFLTESLFTGTHVFKVVTEASSGLELESNIVKITVDDASPVTLETDISPGQVAPTETFVVTVTAEKGLLLVQAVIDNRAVDLIETPLNSGTYMADIIAPGTAGLYGIDIELTDQSGNAEAYQDQAEIEVIEVVVANVPPTATPSFQPASGTSPLVVNFVANASDTDGQIMSYLWDFGDGGSSTQQNPTHEYIYDAQDGEAGQKTYAIQLTVTDNAGATFVASAMSVDAEGNPTSSITILSEVGPGFILLILLSLAISGFYYRRGMNVKALMR